jgi:hypothetical protein
MSNEIEKPVKGETPEQRREAEAQILRKASSGGIGAGWGSNQIITRRNGGVRHQFADDIGGCSANYR